MRLFFVIAFFNWMVVIVRSFLFEVVLISIVPLPTCKGGMIVLLQVVSFIINLI